jgi:hypothetical protein
MLLRENSRENVVKAGDCLEKYMFFAAALMVKL